MVPAMFTKDACVQAVEKSERWLGSLIVDPVALQTKQGMKGKKHFVELLFGYQFLHMAYQSLGDSQGMDRVAVNFKKAIASTHEDAYHDMGKISDAQFAQDSTSYLAAYQLIQWFGLNNPRYISEIKNILPRIYAYAKTRGASRRMAFVVRLQAIGLPSIDTLQGLLDASLIRKRKEYVKLDNTDVYLLVHEVFRLTKNGEQPFFLLTTQDVEYLELIFHFLLKELMASQNVDLLAEVAVAMLFIGRGGSEEWWAAVNYILQRQNTNGAFGDYESVREKVRLEGNPYDVDIGIYLHTTIGSLRVLALSIPFLKGST